MKGYTYDKSLSEKESQILSFVYSGNSHYLNAFNFVHKFYRINYRLHKSNHLAVFKAVYIEKVKTTGSPVVLTLSFYLISNLSMLVRNRFIVLKRFVKSPHLKLFYLFSRGYGLCRTATGTRNRSRFAPESRRFFYILPFRYPYGKPSAQSISRGGSINRVHL